MLGSDRLAVLLVGVRVGQWDGEESTGSQVDGQMPGVRPRFGLSRLAETYTKDRLVEVIPHTEV